MGAPIVIGPGAGEVVGDSPDRRVEILSDDDALHATWSRFGPGREGADLHVHRRHSDLFYVLDGELTVRLGLEDRALPAPTGTLVRITPLVVHGFRNASGAEVRYLNFHAPGQGFADYMRALRDGRTLPYDQEPPPAEGVRPAREAAAGAPDEVTAGVEEIAAAEVVAGAAEPVRPHPHVRSLYVLAGALVVTVDGRELPAEAGAWVQVPRAVAHSVAPAAEPARFLDIRTPSG